MPTPWFKRYRDTGELKVFSKAKAWATPVKDAIATFNSQGFGVKLVTTDVEKDANIVVILTNGPDKYKYYGDTADTGPNFKGDTLHGSAVTLTDQKRNEIFFAAVFLPGKVKGATNGQKEMVVVHEFIHACGLDGGLPNGGKDNKQDHDSVGIMFSTMKKDGNGLTEYLADKGAVSMPPIRVGSQTTAKLKTIWP